MTAAATPEPTLEDIAAARMATGGMTPQAVLEAFLPKPVTHLGQTLVPLKAGHELLLSQLGHPFATGEAFQDIDVLMALFVFSRPSRELFALVATDDFEPEFFKFIDSIPMPDVKALGNDMVAHWLKSRRTALEMENPDSTAQKKTAADSAGSSRQSAPLARHMDGLRTWLFTTFRSAKSSR